ncbi:MAG: flavodoxin family protein [Eggerthellaceae bacterium]|nr:flavodoxin family protein [Eggerthellaceae bacterium]
MKIIAVNGGPRANHNTAQLLDSAIEGARSEGAEVERFDLYKMDYKGCRGCFACKRKGGKSLHKCAIKDGLTPILEAVADADALIVGSPIYFSDITGEIRSFLERLLFQYLPYDTAVEDGTYFPRKLMVGMVYTMGYPQDPINERLAPMERFLGLIFRTQPKSLKVQGCYPFMDSWEKYEAAPQMADMLANRERTWDAQRDAAFSFGTELVKES